jgi:TadE-like protein
MTRFFKRTARAFGREDGNATVEFVVVLPILFSIFMMSFESGLLMIRSILLERATDLTMRELRLGNLITIKPDGEVVQPDSGKLKDEICSRTVIINDCRNSIRIELQPVSQVTWALPSAAANCVDRDVPIQVVETFEVGSQNELMLVRVCVLQRAIFPTLGLGDDRAFVGLGEGLTNTDAESAGFGEYGLVATSTFVNEPS